MCPPEKHTTTSTCTNQRSPNQITLSLLLALIQPSTKLRHGDTSPPYSLFSISGAVARAPNATPDRRVSPPVLPLPQYLLSISLLLSLLLFHNTTKDPFPAFSDPPHQSPRRRILHIQPRRNPSLSFRKPTNRRGLFILLSPPSPPQFSLSLPSPRATLLQCEEQT